MSAEEPPTEEPAEASARAPAGDVRAVKAALRAELRIVRRRIGADPVDRATRSTRIWAGIVPLLDLGGDRARSATEPAPIGHVMLFESLPTEPDTSTWIAWCLEHGIHVHLPAVDGPDLRVVPVDRARAERAAIALDPVELDLVVVPGVAFTAAGDRLGQGGGHYDRFLARLRPGCVTIGVCFAEQLVAAVSGERHDLPVDHVVTDATFGAERDPAAPSRDGCGRR